MPKYHLKIEFCELFFFTFLGVSFIESLMNGGQKLDSKKFFWINSKCSVLGLHLFNKKNHDLN
jgi:hypothetical protein